MTFVCFDMLRCRCCEKKTAIIITRYAFLTFSHPPNQIYLIAVGFHQPVMTDSFALMCRKSDMNIAELKKTMTFVAGVNTEVFLQVTQTYTSLYNNSSLEAPKHIEEKQLNICLLS